MAWEKIFELYSGALSSSEYQWIRERLGEVFLHNNNSTDIVTALLTFIPVTQECAVSGERRRMSWCRGTPSRSLRRGSLDTGTSSTEMGV